MAGYAVHSFGLVRNNGKCQNLSVCIYCLLSLTDTWMSARSN